MAFDRANLARLGSNNTGAGALWLYQTTDTAATVNTAGYFNSASGEMNVNDIIFSVSATGGTPVVTITYVNSNASGVVDTVDGTVVSAIDTD